MNLVKKVFKIWVFSAAFGVFLFFILPYALPVNQKTLAAGELPFADSKFIRVENLNLHYRIWAPLSDSCKGNILLIHGFCGSTFSWRNNTDTFSAHGFRVVAVDLPGFGYSDRSPGVNHSASFNAGLLWQMLDSINSGPWVIAGHSMGAGVAWAMAASRPAHTSKLIAVDGAYMDGRRTQPTGLSSLLLTSGPAKRLAEVLGKAFFFKPNKIRQLLTSAYSSPIDSASVVGYLKPLMLKNTASSILDMAASKELADFNLQAAQSPVLAIWGKNDHWLPYTRFEKYLNAVPHLKTAVVDGAGHCPMETHSQTFNRLVLDFMEQ